MNQAPPITDDATVKQENNSSYNENGISEAHIDPIWHAITKPYEFVPGDTVWIRPRRCYGRIVANTAPFQWKIQVLDNPQEKVQLLLRQRHLIPSPDFLPGNDTASSKRTHILVTPETSLFRLLAEVPPPHADSASASTGILEIGCSTGETSQVLWKHHHHDHQLPHQDNLWLGWDSGADMVQRVQERIRLSNSTTIMNRRVARINPLEQPHAAAAMLRECFLDTNRQLDSVFVDIGGNRCAEDVLAVLRWVLLQTVPSRVVVKNRELYQRLAIGRNNTTVAASAYNPFSLFTSAQRRRYPTHPLQAELRLAPATAASASEQRQPICRYHNYHVDGCRKYRSASSTVCCPYDHIHCHWCLQPGHRALQCPLLESLM